MDRTFIADLHNHTTASDGEYTPTELVNQAADLGLQALGGKRVVKQRAEFGGLQWPRFIRWTNYSSTNWKTC